jgi:hypothetical protein
LVVETEKVEVGTVPVLVLMIVREKRLAGATLLTRGLQTSEQIPAGVFAAWVV